MSRSGNTNPGCNPYKIYVGCAGWGIPKEHADRFASPKQGGDPSRLRSHLERYALRLPAVEINSSFYRSHKPATYARWAASVPEDFRFSVKVPRQITHLQRLHSSEETLIQFLDEAESLGDKLGPLLVQLPPSLRFEGTVACTFFEVLRRRYQGSVVCEPRHPDWFEREAEQVMRRFEIARVAADPAVPVREAAAPGDWGGTAYYRLHGSPRTYYSEYSQDYLTTLAQSLAQQAHSREVWCIFDNTALGAATTNALSILERLRASDGYVRHSPITNPSWRLRNGSPFSVTPVRASLRFRSLHDAVGETLHPY